MSFLVVQRTHEIGVRMALGAQRSDVLKLVLVRSLKLISAGTIIGLIVALMSTHTLRALLYSVSAFERRHSQLARSTWRHRAGGKLSAGNARNQGRPNGRARSQHLITYDQASPSRTQIPVRQRRSFSTSCAISIWISPKANLFRSWVRLARVNRRCCTFSGCTTTAGRANIL
jgi:ABC-type antimicrobial peptide transport system, permease component